MDVPLSFSKMRTFNKSALFSSENMPRENSSTEVIRFVGAREKPAVLKEETMQENSMASLLGNSYPLAFMEAYRLAILGRS